MQDDLREVVREVIAEELKKLAGDVLIKLIKLTDKSMDVLGFSEKEKERTRLVNTYSMVIAFITTLLMVLQTSLKEKAKEIELDDKNVGG